MLSYISNKFVQEPKVHLHEPRAALFLNRFTRTLTIMFATNGLDAILGVSAEQLKGKSFYYCIAENCLPDAIRCLEGAKANDSIAYLRFWFRNPLQEDPQLEDAQMDDVRSSDEDEDEGGVQLDPQGEGAIDGDLAMQDDTTLPAAAPSTSGQHAPQAQEGTTHTTSRSSGNGTDPEHLTTDHIFDGPRHAQSSSSSVTLSTVTEQQSDRHSTPRGRARPTPVPVEVEAVVSATSDGLVVILRRARPIIPQTLQRPAPVAQPTYNTGFFASPWAPHPINPPPFAPQPVYEPDFNFNYPTAPRPPGPPTYQEPQVPAPPTAAQGLDFMNTIREVAVFAWSLTGINGSLAQYSRGSPSGESQPPGGMPIWDPASNADPENFYNGFADNHTRRVYRSEAGSGSSGSGSGSDGEVVWRRAAEMPEWHPRDGGSGGGSGVGTANGIGSGESEDENALRRMRLL